MITQSTNEKTVLILSAGTDGRVAFWDITTLLMDTFKVIDRNLENDCTRMGGDALGTDNDDINPTETLRSYSDSHHIKSLVHRVLESWRVRDVGSPIHVAHLHQSGVNALDIRWLKGESSCMNKALFSL